MPIPNNIKLIFTVAILVSVSAPAVAQTGATTSTATTLEHSKIDTNLGTIFSVSAAVSFFTVPLLHEGLGHGGATLATGNTVRFVSSTFVDSAGETSAENRFIALGATGVNAMVGAASLALLYTAPPEDGPSYYFLWLMAATNLFSSFGYLITAPFGYGDWAVGLDGVKGELGWKIGAMAVGSAATIASAFLLLPPAEKLLGREPHRSERKWLLTLVPYLLSAALATGSAALNREAKSDAIISGLVGTLGGGLFLAYLPIFFFDDAAEETPEALSIPWDTGWAVTGGSSALVHVGLFGPGIGDAIPEEEQ